MFQKPIIFGIIQVVKFPVLINSGIFPLHSSEVRHLPSFTVGVSSQKLQIRLVGMSLQGVGWGLIADVAGWA